MVEETEKASTTKEEGEVGDTVIFQDVIVVVQEGEGTAKIVWVAETGSVGEAETEEVLNHRGTVE